jgi:MoxR-like ATPase
MSDVHFKSTLARLPAAALIAVGAKHGINSTDKSLLVRALTAKLLKGEVTLDQITGGAPAAPAVPSAIPSAVPSAIAAKVDTLREDVTACSGAIGSVAHDVQELRAMWSGVEGNIQARITRETEALGALLQSARTALTEEITGAVQSAQGAIAAAQAEVAGLRANALTEATRSEVAEAVRQAFGPFASLVREQGREAEVSAAAAAPTGRSEAFPGSPLVFDSWADPEAPAVDPDYLWTSEAIAHCWLSQHGDPLWITGPKGTGKSSLAAQFAARTGRAFTRINFQRYTTTEDFIGATGLTNGSTGFVPGAFLTAYTRSGAVILLDEVSNADPGVLAVLNGLLEPGARVTIGGRVWSRASGVCIMAADNTAGSGDQTGSYAGTRQMNSAFLDRFSRLLYLGWLDRDQEIDAVAARAACKRELAAHVVDAIRVCRSKVESGTIVDAPSIRQAIGFIRALAALDPEKAWQSCIQLRQPPESAAALFAVYQSEINPEYVASLI